MPFAYSDYRLNISVNLVMSSSENNPFLLAAKIEYELHLKTMAQIVQTISESGATNNYVNIFELSDKGAKVGKFEITSFETVINDTRKSHFSWWNPKLDLGLFAGFDGKLIYGGDLGISIMSYGKSGNDLSWRFLRFSAMLHNNSIGIGLCPISWNAGDPYHF